MNEKTYDPFGLSVELDGVAAISACLSILILNEGDQPSNEILGNALLGIEKHLERISADVGALEKSCSPEED